MDEIEEGLNDATKYHPVFKNDAAISTILEKFTAQPTHDIRAAIENKDRTKFGKSFNNLTNACNGCHQLRARASSSSNNRLIYQAALAIRNLP